MSDMRQRKAMHVCLCAPLHTVDVRLAESVEKLDDRRLIPVGVHT